MYEEMNKMDVKVLAVPAKKLFKDGVWEGLRTDLNEKEFLKLVDREGIYKRRGDLEEDKNYKQIIPQIVLVAENKLFIHRIPQTGSEKRLHDLWPIVLGGHVDKGDLGIEEAAMREFREEIDYQGMILKKTFFGAVHLQDNPVNRVHVGLIWIFQGDKTKFRERGDDGIIDGRFITFKEGEKYFEKMSYWSKLIFPVLKKRLAKGGLQKDISSGLGKNYVDYLKDSFSRNYIEGPEILRLLRKVTKSSSKVLEVGCGSGHGISFLTKAGVKERNVTGIDIDGELLGQAAKDYPKVVFLKRDIRKPFQLKDKFDVIFCNFVIHYFDKKVSATVIGEMRKVLKKGGVVLFTVPHPIRWVNGHLSKYFERKTRLIPTPWGKELPYSHKTMGDYINLMTQSGFEVMEVSEPEVLLKGKEVSMSEYEKYTKCPSRLMILARKK